MASRCDFVMRGARIPFDVLTTSRSADVFGVVVPIPVLPEDGKMFCALLLNANTATIRMTKAKIKMFSNRNFQSILN